MNKQNKLNKNKTLGLVQLSMLVAIIIIMGFTPVGFLRLGTIEITFIVIPVAIGAVLLGASGGAVLGGVFGLVSFLQCFTGSPFGAFCLSLSPIFTFILCFFPRLITGYLTGLISELLAKKRVNNTVNCIVSSLCCPLLNTLTFIATFAIFFGNNAKILEFFGETNFFGVILALLSLNALIEAGVTFITGAAVSRVLIHFMPKKGNINEA